MLSKFYNLCRKPPEPFIHYWPSRISGSNENLRIIMLSLYEFLSKTWSVLYIQQMSTAEAKFSLVGGHLSMMWEMQKIYVCIIHDDVLILMTIMMIHILISSDWKTRSLQYCCLKVLISKSFIHLEAILKKNISFANYYYHIPNENIRIIDHCRKKLIFNENEPWKKKASTWQ